METKLYFKTGQSREDIDIFEQPISGTHHLVKKIVYQNENYKLVIKTNANIKNIMLLINNKEGVCGECGIFHNDDGFEFIYDVSQAINVMFGNVYISVIMTMEDGTEAIYFAEPVGIAIPEKNNEVQLSLEEMLKDILEKENTLLVTKSPSSILERLQSQFKSRIDMEIEVIDYVFKTYTFNFRYFTRDIRSTMTEMKRIDRFEKLRTIKPQTLHYIATHVEQFEQVNFPTGMSVYNNYHVQPRNTLVSQNKSDHNTYENRVIIGFLEHLVKYMRKKQTDINNLLNNVSLTEQSESHVKPGYILSTKIIELYTQSKMELYLKQVTERIGKANELLMKYRSIIKCAGERVEGPPKNTPVFQNIHHYRNVFAAISQFFIIGKIDTARENQILSFSTADQIYEYYCLLAMFTAFDRLGYAENVKKRMRYAYDISQKYLNRLDDNENTYFFTKGDEEVVLYCQPIVYSWKNKNKNQISLYRTDRDFYIPDFVIKHTVGNQVVNYCVLDSKWQMRYNINLEMMLYKYYVKIADDQDKPGKYFFWIMQGKDDDHEKLYRLNSGAISRTKPDDITYQTGIVTLTPRTGEQYLIQVMDRFLARD